MVCFLRPGELFSDRDLIPQIYDFVLVKGFLFNPCFFFNFWVLLNPKPFRSHEVSTPVFMHLHAKPLGLTLSETRKPSLGSADLVQRRSVHS